MIQDAETKRDLKIVMDRVQDTEDKMKTLIDNFAPLDFEEQRLSEEIQDSMSNIWAAIYTIKERIN